LEEKNLALSNKNGKKNRGLIRYPIFALGIMIAIFALLKGEIKEATISFSIGALGGFILDCIGVAKLKLWYYTKQPFLSKSYFAIVIPAWGIFSMAVNLLWNKIPFPEIITFSLLTLGLFSLHEIPNLKTSSWKYSVSMKVVVPGWVPLVWGVRIIFLLLQPLI
jgi:hypothetical protein